MSISEVCLATLLCLVVLHIGCNHRGSASPAEEGQEARSAPSGVRCFICERFEVREDGAREWRAYKVSDVNGVRLVEEWITNHRDAIARGEEAGVLSVYPETTLTEFSQAGIAGIPLIRRLPDPRDIAKPKAERRYIENISHAEMKQLHNLVTKHGELVDWARENVEDPSMFMSHPRSHKPLPESGETQDQQ